MRPAPKCIVYSGFRTHLDVIDLALSGAKVNFANIARIGMSRRDKDRALASFRADPDVSVLLLDRARPRRASTCRSCRGFSWRSRWTTPRSSSRLCRARTAWDRDGRSKWKCSP